MKKIVFLLVCLFSMTMVKADDGKPVEVDQLPEKARAFVTSHFKNLKVAMAKREEYFFYKSYNVVFTDGVKVEFDGSGDWTEVQCKQGEVPTQIVPKAIRDYMKTNYPDVKILEIERDSRGYEIKLSNGMEIKFDSKYRVIDIDN